MNQQMNWLFIVCVLRFFWRSYPQSNTPEQSLITNFWPQAPSNIDAAFESRDLDTVFFFKGICSLFRPKLKIWYLSR